MDLYRIILCFFPEDEKLASAFFNLPNTTPHCQHMSLPDGRASMCCRPRRVLYRVVRTDRRCDRIAPRKKKDQPMPPIWSQTPDLSRQERRMDDLNSGANSPLNLDMTECVRQLHRLADYFSPSDESKQLEIISCFSNPSLMEADESGCECLFSALLRMVEYQNCHLTFVCPAGQTGNVEGDEDSSLPRQWLRKLSGRLVTIDDDTQQSPPLLPMFWRGGIRLTTDENCPFGGLVRGLQLLHLGEFEQSPGSPDDYCVSVSPSHWLDVIQEVAMSDVCPLAISPRRWSLCVQSELCLDAVHFISELQSLSSRRGALLCRLGLLSVDSGPQDSGNVTAKTDFMPGSERWLAQLINELRSAGAPSSIPPLSLLLLLLPYSSSSFLALGLRQAWELPLPTLHDLAALTDREEEDEDEAWRHWGEDLPVARARDGPRCRLAEVATRGPSEAELRPGGVEELLEALVGRMEVMEDVEESPGRREESKKTSDHLVQAMLRCFKQDGSAALEPVEKVVPERRPLVDAVEDQSHLHWPKAANVFYHGIDYNRGIWCEQREDRLKIIQKNAIQHETMCTVTLFGCRGNATMPCVVTDPPSIKVKKQEKPMNVVKKKVEKKEQQKAPRSARHSQKLREVVTHILRSNGISKSHASYGALSENLFEATKTMIKMQNLPNSHNLKEKMIEVAQLQFQVMKQLKAV